MEEKNKNKKNTKRRKKKSHKGPVLLIAFFLIVAAVGGFYVYLLNFSNNSSKLPSPNISKQVEKDEPVNILVMGVDIGNPKNSAEPKRTDTIILLHYNPVSQKAEMISIPRDTLIQINGKNQKINAAHAFGGVNLLVEEVEELLSIDVNYYAKVDYDGFRNVIDSIGGVDVTIPNNMYYDDASQNLHINFKKGENVHLDGKKAEEFFRWRQNNDGTGLANGDIGRIENQHMLMEKIIDKFKSPAILLRIPSLMSALPKYVETNMNPDEIIKYAYNFGYKVDKSNMKMATLQGEGEYINGVSYYIFKKSLNKQILTVLHEESNVETFDKSSFKIDILNGTNRNGLAARVSSKLQQKGYVNIKTANGNKNTKSKLVVNGLSKEVEQILKRDFNIENIEYDEDGENNYIKAILGDDFKE
ncbi:LCP family protein [Clostridium sp. HMP27]|uniref:LCP family protein n=1 Tax=Clostridium sp. HMP27 TaxID=1487921 RepID=UPI00052B8E5A|nr:LCP family protein [Clostridium sp. HMP27]KGK87950.1 transcriptional regulator [Clostridium sp. HMP27]